MIMAELSPRARELLRAGTIRPSAADRARIQKALQARLGMPAPSVPESPALPAPRSRWPFISSAIVGVGLMGGAVYLSQRHAPETVVPAQAPAAAAVVTSPASPESTPPVEAATVSALPAAVAPGAPAPSSHTARDRLAQEVALLERATSALHAGRPADALKVLDEYQRKFPSGLLSQDRGSARAQALCALGRRSEAQAELARLPAQSPGSARAKQVCDASAKTTR
jgi:hypothetical protein